MDLQLDGLRAVVTGSSDGIGEEIRSAAHPAAGSLPT
jgi:short-subunit dehydrogenase